MLDLVIQWLTEEDFLPEEDDDEVEHENGHLRRILFVLSQHQIQSRKMELNSDPAANSSEKNARLRFWGAIKLLVKGF